MARRPVLVALIGTIVGVMVWTATLTTAAPPTPSPTELVAQVQITGLQGEGEEDNFEGAIEARAFDFLATNQGGNSPAFRKFEILAFIDRASPGLLRRLTLGTVISEVKVSLTRPTAQGLFVYKIFTLNRARVTSLREYVSGHVGDIPSMEVSFVYKKLDVEHRIVNQEGNPESTSFCWLLDADTTC